MRVLTRDGFRVMRETAEEALRRSGKDLRWVEKKAAAQKLKIDDVYLMVACPDGSCDIVAKERGR